MATSLALTMTHEASQLVFADLVESLRNAELGLLLDRIVSSQPRLLLVGETGTGKSSLVHYLYQKAVERGKIPEKYGVVTLNMAAIPTELAESTLFGHVAGAFTSANSTHCGAFEEAGFGVLFLDEIHHAPPTVQRKLLVALQDREFCLLGDSTQKKKPINAWVIAGTTQPERIEAELRHRLGDFILTLKPLAERKRAFPKIVHGLLKRITLERWPNRMGDQPIELITPRQAIEWLGKQPWPGNIRELESVLRTASFFVAEPKAGLTLEQLKKAYQLRQLSVGAEQETSGEPLSETPQPLKLKEQLAKLIANWQELPQLEQWKRDIVAVYCERCASKAAAARALGLDVKTLNNLLRHNSSKAR